MVTPRLIDIRLVRTRDGGVRAKSEDGHVMLRVVGGCDDCPGNHWTDEGPCCVLRSGYPLLPPEDERRPTWCPLDAVSAVVLVAREGEG